MKGNLSVLAFLSSCKIFWAILLKRSSVLKMAWMTWFSLNVEKAPGESGLSHGKIMLLLCMRLGLLRSKSYVPRNCFATAGRCCSWRHGLRRCWPMSLVSWRSPSELAVHRWPTNINDQNLWRAALLTTVWTLFFVVLRIFLLILLILTNSYEKVLYMQDVYFCVVLLVFIISLRID